MRKPLTIQSKFAILDVLSKEERRELQLQLKQDVSICVVVRGRLRGAWGPHDSESQEYWIEVSSVEVVENGDEA